MAAARGPLTLRDFLELACDSSSDGFRSYPRCLPSSRAADSDALALLQPPSWRPEADDLHRSPSRSPSSLFVRSPGALARISSLSRSFSRRIFVWRRRGDDDEDHLYDDLDDRDSCGFPSPLVSSCSASDDSGSEYEADDVAVCDDKMVASTSASQCELPSSSSSSSSSAADHHCTDDDAPGAAAKDGNEMQTVAAEDKLGREEDNKQQLSPVSVLDFRFDDDDRSDAGTCSPSFSFQRCCPTTKPPPDHHHLLHGRTTTKQQAQLLHKIRRYDDGVVAEAVDPVDLDARFTATSDSSGESLDASTHHLATTSSSSTDTTSTSATTMTAPSHGEEHQSVERPLPPDQEHEEPDEYRMLAWLLREHTAAAAAVDDEVSLQELMLDFFAEGIDRLRSTPAGPVVGTVDADDRRGTAVLVGAAAEWLRGAGPQWGIRDVMLSGKAALEDMERGRRWMSVAEEERDVGAEVEGLVTDELVDELVAELLVVPWWHAQRWPSMDTCRAKNVQRCPGC